MVIVDENKIYITRGDTAVVNIQLYEDDEPYTFKTGDKVILSVKRKYPFNDCVLEKVSTTGSFGFLVIDTYQLAFGTYDYDLTFYGVDGTVDTVILGEFEIGKESHTNVNS